MTQFVTQKGGSQLGLRSLWVHFGQDPRKVLGTRNVAPYGDDSIEEGGGLGSIWPRGATQRALGYSWCETWRYGVTV